MQTLMLPPRNNVLEGSQLEPDTHHASIQLITPRAVDHIRGSLSTPWTFTVDPCPPELFAGLDRGCTLHLAEPRTMRCGCIGIGADFGRGLLVAVSDWRNDRVRSAIEGRNPTVFAELGSAFAVLGDVQFLPGYALALTKIPGVDRLTDLRRGERVRFLADVDLVATAVEAVCTVRDPQYRRTNVEILGNTHHFLHAHIWPRYEWEPVNLVSGPVWAYPADRWNESETMLGPRHDELRSALIDEVARLRNSIEFDSGAVPPSRNE